MEIITLLGMMLDDACNSAILFEAWEEEADTIAISGRGVEVANVCSSLVTDWEGSKDHEILLRKDADGNYTIDTIRYINSDGVERTEIVAAKIASHIEREYLAELYYMMCEKVADYALTVW